MRLSGWRRGRQAERKKQWGGREAFNRGLAFVTGKRKTQGIEFGECVCMYVYVFAEVRWLAAEVYSNVAAWGVRRGVCPGRA